MMEGLGAWAIGDDKLHLLDEKNVSFQEVREFLWRNFGVNWSLPVWHDCGHIRFVDQGFAIPAIRIPTLECGN